MQNVLSEAKPKNYSLHLFDIFGHYLCILTNVFISHQDTQLRLLHLHLHAPPTMAADVLPLLPHLGHVAGGAGVD